MGVELQWDVGLLPICHSLDAQAMNELQFMLLESLSNVLQHAHARVLRVEGHLSAGGEAERVYVRLVDDGDGFDPATVQGSGLATMRERAAAIGAQLRISSQAGRTAVEIQITV
jgi:signal transduction histidine kinase